MKFTELSPAEQRVALAKDAIKYIDAKKIEIGTNNWVVPLVDGALAPFSMADIGQDLCSVFQKQECKACALGALLYAFVCEVPGTKYEGYFSAPGLLRNVFSFTQLQLIEFTFEAGDGWVQEGTLDDDDEVAAMDFAAKYEDEDERARAIFQNIITNEGIFKP